MAWLVVALAAPAFATSATAAMRVTIGSATIDGASTVYPVKIEAVGAPALVLIPPSLREADLLVNGRLVRRAGRDVLAGMPPFGHGASAFSLAGLTPRDRIAIRFKGVGERPRILHDADALAIAFGSGLASGGFIGFLTAIAIVQWLFALTLRDRTLALYVGWVTAVILIELDLDGLLPLSQSAAGNFSIVVGALALICSVAFTAVYLKLRREAPRLFWLLVVTNACVAVAPALIVALTHRPLAPSVIYGPDAVGVGVGIAIAAARRRAGFKPASYLAFGLVGFFLVFASQLVRNARGIDLPLLDRWSLEAGAIFDFSVFAIGTAYRSRTLADERHELAAALEKANVEATHDRLTGLLNRRGLEAVIDDAKHTLGTVLFVDLDGFKAVNDEGGHAAGDETLVVVARIIRQSVRSRDAVARIGGDEFVIYLRDCVDPAVVRDCVSRISSAISSLRPLGVTSETRIGASIGCALVHDARAFSEALEEADADAYRVKARHHAEQRSLTAASAASTR